MEVIMAREDIAAGKTKQLRGKLNDIVGAAKDDPARQIKGKAQKAVGKVQEKIGRRSRSER
jgi:uncharacterized protein YjbJ (UPF0337 family)